MGLADMKMSIENCAKALREAQAAFDAVEAEKKKIDSKMSAATNALNQAQKTFDEAVNEMKKAAPWNTNWHQRRIEHPATPQ